MSNNLDKNVLTYGGKKFVKIVQEKHPYARARVEKNVKRDDDGSGGGGARKKHIHERRSWNICILKKEREERSTRVDKRRRKQGEGQGLEETASRSNFEN